MDSIKGIKTGIIMRSHEIEKYRTTHPFGFERNASYGWFEVPSPIKKHEILYVMASPSDSDWDHVSVSCKRRCPTWPEMCFIKDLFYGDATVVQFHPQKSEYVNNHKYCLHLWKWNGGAFPCPPHQLVGIKDG